MKLPAPLIDLIIDYAREKCNNCGDYRLILFTGWGTHPFDFHRVRLCKLCAWQYSRHGFVFRSQSIKYSFPELGQNSDL